MECSITFKNVAETGSDASNGVEGGQHQRKASRVANHATNSKNNSDSFFSFKSPQSLFSSRRSYSIGSPRKPSHRTASSLSSPPVASQSFPPSSGPSTPRNWRPGHNHKRSVSILSIESEGQPEKTPPAHGINRGKPARGHGRSASLQVGPRRNDSYDDSYRKGTYLKGPCHRFMRGVMELITPLSRQSSRPSLSTYRVPGRGRCWRLDSRYYSPGSLQPSRISCNKSHCAHRFVTCASAKIPTIPVRFQVSRCPTDDRT